MYGDIHYITNSICKKKLKINFFKKKRHPSRECELKLVENSPVISSLYLYCTCCIEEHVGITLRRPILLHVTSVY